MKNYYEILEVDRNASKEIIEKAYKTLAKKYHPDVQEQNQKKIAEEKMKLINEAYSVLSDENQKEEYDKQLEDDIISKEMYQELVQENIELKRKMQNNANANNKYINQQYVSYNQPMSNRQSYDQEEYNNKMNQAVNKAYYDAYIQDLKNRGYRIRYKKTIKDYAKNLLALILTILIFLVIVQIPFIKKFFISMYEDNIVIQVFVDTIKQIFKN